jgi:hypothetical protein
MSNDRHEYDTGAVRSADCDDVRYDLISPIGLRALARTYAEGAKKFGAGNWENGMPVTDMLNHAIAHVYNFLGGDRSEDHLAHATWNLLGAIHSMELWPHLNKDVLRTENCGAPPCVTNNQVQASSSPPVHTLVPAQQQQVAQTPSTFEALRALVAASNR